MKKRKTRVRHYPSILEIGLKPVAIVKVRDALLSILKSKAPPLTQIEAVKAMADIIKVGPVSISNCTFTTRK